MREAEPLDVAQQQGVAHRQRHEHGGDQDVGNARARAAALAVRHGAPP